MKPHGSGGPTGKIQKSWIVAYLPLLGSPLTLFLFSWGMWIEYVKTRELGHSSLFDERVFGAGAESGSVVYIALQISFLTTALAYNLTLYVTFAKRHIWKEVLTKCLSVIETLEKEYEVKCDCRRIKWILNSLVLGVLAYVFLLMLFFGIIIKGETSKILLPICSFIQTTTIFLSAYDMLSIMFLFSEIFGLIKKISGRKYKNSLLMAYFDTLDLLEVVSKSYGLRESINIGNEFLVIIAQISYIVYQVLSIEFSPLLVIMFGFIATAPKAFKIWALAYCGSMLTDRVRG